MKRNRNYRIFNNVDFALGAVSFDVGGQWELALPPATNAEALFYRLMK
jgi:gamma-glutamylcysteine synthetase